MDAMAADSASTPTPFAGMSQDTQGSRGHGPSQRRRLVLLGLVGLLVLLAGAGIWWQVRAASLPTSAHVIGTQFRTEVDHTATGAAFERLIQSEFLTRTLTDVATVQQLYNATLQLPEGTISAQACAISLVNDRYSLTFYRGAQVVLQVEGGMGGNCGGVYISGERGFRVPTPDYVTTLQHAWPHARPAPP
jgi:hypothetical protein